MEIVGSCSVLRRVCVCPSVSSVLIGCSGLSDSFSHQIVKKAPGDWDGSCVSVCLMTSNTSHNCCRPSRAQISAKQSEDSAPAAHYTHIYYYPWCLGVSCGVNHRKDAAADNQRPTHAPLCYVPVCVLACECAWVCAEMCSSVQRQWKRCLGFFLQLRADYVTCVCVFLQFAGLCVGGWRCWGCTGPLGVSRECSLRLDPLFNTKTTPLTLCMCVCVSMYSKISCVLGRGGRINYRLSFCSANLTVCLQRTSESNSIKRKWRETANGGRIFNF